MDSINSITLIVSHDFALKQNCSFLKLLKRSTIHYHVVLANCYSTTIYWPLFTINKFVYYCFYAMLEQNVCLYYTQYESMILRVTQVHLNFKFWIIWIFQMLIFIVHTHFLMNLPIFKNQQRLCMCFIEISSIWLVCCDKIMGTFHKHISNKDISTYSLYDGND